MTTPLPDHVRNVILKKTTPRVQGDRDSTDIAIRDAVRAVTRSLMDLLEQHLAADEVLLDVLERTRHRAGLRGVRAEVALLVLTDRRILLAREDQIDEVPASVTQHAYGSIQVRPKMVQLGIEVIVEPTGLVVECSKGKADEVRAALTSPPAQALWIAGPGHVRGGGTPAVPAASSASPAGWHADPSGRHEHRYWDGATWTAHVSDAGVQTSDPLG